MADITFFGFDIDPEEAKGNLSAVLGDLAPGWFFVFKEMVGEINFGLDVGMEGSAPSTYPNWNEVDWISFTSEEFIDTNKSISSIVAKPDYLNENILWGKNASNMAFITYRQPTMVAYHSINLIP